MTTGCIRGNRNMAVCMNLIFLAASLCLIGTGAGLMGFYRLHMLDVISIEFLLVPLFLTVGGILNFLSAIFGFYVMMREDSCLMITYACILSIEFCILLSGVICSIKLLFEIQTGLFDADVIPQLTLYETDPYIRYKWDTLQREFSCCGGYSYTLGYTDWKHTLMGGAHNSVPDSCCLYETPNCGADIFAITDLRVVIGKIHTHGCLTTMLRRLDTHVMVILIVYGAVGGILAILHLLAIVSSCCQAAAMSKVEQDDWDYEYERSTIGPATPQNINHDLSSHHETAF